MEAESRSYERVQYILPFYSHTLRNTTDQIFLTGVKVWWLVSGCWCVGGNIRPVILNNSHNYPPVTSQQWCSPILQLNCDIDVSMYIWIHDIRRRHPLAASILSLEEGPNCAFTIITIINRHFICWDAFSHSTFINVLVKQSNDLCRRPILCGETKNINTCLQ